MFSPEAPVGTHDGPVSPENYKRAVYLSPPEHFSIQMLTPTKQGSSVNFGMRISPIILDEDLPSPSSVSSHSSRSRQTIEYDIWRKWEDCLYLQEMLEHHYNGLAREKRNRLLAGKGVKDKDGFYRQGAGQAASFESLPPGPDPNMVARDVHELIPRLTKKGTIFRASQATIDQRYHELRALMQSLFRDDVPTLLNDLRNHRMITDFFGYWRRDYDLARKQSPQGGTRQRHDSLTSEIYSTYFASSPSLASPTQRRSSTSSRRHSASSSSSSGSSSGSSLHTLQHSTAPPPPTKLEALPEDGDPQFGTRDAPLPLSRDNRHSWQTVDSVSTYLDGLHLTIPDPHPQRDRNSMVSYAESFMTTDSADAVIPERTAYLEGLDLMIPEPPGQNSVYGTPGRRDSVATFMTNDSVATFMTDATETTDAVVPAEDQRTLDNNAWSPYSERHWSPSEDRWASSLRRSASERATTARRRKGFSIVSKTSSLGSEDSRLDSGLFDSFPLPPFADAGPGTPMSPSTRMTTPEPEPELDEDRFEARTVKRPSNPAFSQSTSSFSRSPPPPSSPTASFESEAPSRTSIATALSVETGETSSTATSTSTITPRSAARPVIIKASYGRTIIMLRATRALTYAELRYRLFDKFVRQEQVELAEDFSVAVLLTPKGALGAVGLPGATAFGSAWAVGTNVVHVDSQREWDRALARCAREGEKVNIRVFDSHSRSRV